MRKMNFEPHDPGSTVTLKLKYSPLSIPSSAQAGFLDWPAFLRYLNARATSGVEIIHLGNSPEARYIRSIDISGCIGTLVLEHHPTRPELTLTIRGDAVRHANEIAARVRRICDLDVDLAHVHQILGVDRSLRPLLTASPGIRVPGAWSAFELLVRTIVGQQVTVKAATTIIGRIASRFGQRLKLGNEPSPLLLFPTPLAIAEGDLTGIGMPGKRIETLRFVARAVADQTIPDIEQTGNNDAIKTALLSIPGIGPWTVEYFALRALRDTDAWPESDLVLKRATNQLCDSTSLAANRKHAMQWSPYRGYVAMHFWHRAAQMASGSTELPYS